MAAAKGSPDDVSRSGRPIALNSDRGSSAGPPFAHNPETLSHDLEPLRPGTIEELRAHPISRGAEPRATPPHGAAASHASAAAPRRSG